MKEVYAHREPEDTLASIGIKIDKAAVEAGVILSAKKRKVLINECIRNGKVIIKQSESKVHKELNRVTVSVFTETRALLNERKAKKRFLNLDDLLIDCLTKLDAIEKVVKDCSGDDSDCKKLYDSLYELFYGQEKISINNLPNDFAQSFNCLVKNGEKR